MRRLQRPSPAMIVACTALVLSLAGGAYAASKIKTKDIAKDAVTGSKIADDAVKNAKIKNNSISGAKIDESTLGQVPQAANADTAGTAAKLAGQDTFYFGLAYGEGRVIVSNGNVALTATCDEPGGGVQRARILASTTQDGSILKSGNDNLLGPGSSGASATFLTPSTPADNREFAIGQDTDGLAQAFFELDGGYVADADGNMVSIEEEGLLMAINYLGSDCVFAGVSNTLKSQQ